MTKLPMGSSNCVHCGSLQPNNAGECSKCGKFAFIKDDDVWIKSFEKLNAETSIPKKMSQTRESH